MYVGQSMSDDLIHELEHMSGEVDGLSLQSSIVDAINIYCREVLGPANAIDRSQVVDQSGSEANSAKHAIAAHVAKQALGGPSPSWPEVVRSARARASRAESAPDAPAPDPALKDPFQQSRPRTDEQWRNLLGELAEALSIKLGRALRISSFEAETDDPTSPSWFASAAIRVLFAPIPHVEGVGNITVRVEPGESTFIWADLDFYVDNVVISTGKSEIFHFRFVPDEGWVEQGWRPDDTDGWRLDGV
jgi:hypothetical protein